MNSTGRTGSHAADAAMPLAHSAAPASSATCRTEFRISSSPDLIEPAGLGRLVVTRQLDAYRRAGISSPKGSATRSAILPQNQLYEGLSAAASTPFGPFPGSKAGHGVRHPAARFVEPQAAPFPHWYALCQAANV